MKRRRLPQAFPASAAEPLRRETQSPLPAHSPAPVSEQGWTTLACVSAGGAEIGRISIRGASIAATVVNAAERVTLNSSLPDKGGGLHLPERERESNGKGAGLVARQPSALPRAPIRA